MPAIDLARLKAQAEALADLFNQPEAFIYLLHETLDHYTNRTVRFSQKAIRTPLPSYQTPRPVMRQIENTLSSLAVGQPNDAIHLVEALWNAGYYEMRLLAASLLGKIPPEAALSLFTQLPDWLNQTSDREVQEALLTDALATLRTRNPDILLTLLESWLKDAHHKTQTWGLRALLPLLQSSDFENLPVVFRILQPTIVNASPAIQIDLQNCLITLEQISPVETAHYLQAIIEGNPNTHMLRTLRRIMPLFSPTLQAELRGLLRSSM